MLVNPTGEKKYGDFGNQRLAFPDLIALSIGAVHRMMKHGFQAKVSLVESAVMNSGAQLLNLVV
jgi:hypothetical protein